VTERGSPSTPSGESSGSSPAGPRKQTAAAHASETTHQGHDASQRASVAPESPQGESSPTSLPSTDDQGPAQAARKPRRRITLESELESERVLRWFLELARKTDAVCSLVDHAKRGSTREPIPQWMGAA